MGAQWHENIFFFYVRKPYWVPTTFGDKTSFLETLIATSSSQIQQLQYNRAQSDNKELGLVNRLDNETAWLLFFAKDQIIYNEYKLKQAAWQVNKIYYADLRGELKTKNWELRTPIYHHYSDPTHMTLDPKLARGKAHEVHTIIQPLYFDPDAHSTTCRIVIQKGIRHQIRIHTASIGHHIIGDQLYCPKSLRSDYKNISWIHLRSTGIEVTSN
jgi:23S rRNA-/tRNA-specific pseudouridylate synthase